VAKSTNYGALPLCKSLHLLLTSSLSDPKILVQFFALTQLQFLEVRPWNERPSFKVSET
jgi:hypothetical protein